VEGDAGAADAAGAPEQEVFMKIAVSSEGKNLSSAIDTRFGRAKWFIIVDTEADAVAAIPNKQNLSAPQGAGIQSAANLARQHVDCVITGHCGPNAFKTLRSQGIDVISVARGTVQEVLEKFRKGELKSLHAPDVEGHWV
jgi:predicted Fe-Mo cluster-binding NifX family protein